MTNSRWHLRRTVAQFTVFLMLLTFPKCDALYASIGMAPSATLSDPIGSSVIVAAVQWLEGTLLGTVATTVAIIAVAGVGLMALSGRVEVRRALTVILGCFILFGASSIVAGIRGAIDGNTADFAAPQVVTEETSPLRTLPKHPADHDPYAGAAVPIR